MPSAMPPTPTYQTAIIASGPGQLIISHNEPIPTLTPGTVLVRTTAVALNPADAKMVDYSATPGAINGYDFVGEIVTLGPGLSRRDLAVGDCVCGLVHGMNALAPKNGAFAEYVAADSDFLLKVPEGMELIEAASLGTGVATAGMALFNSLRIPATPAQPAQTPEFVLVYGGSTATGTIALQLLKLANLRPIAVCSPRNFDLATSYGAEATFDYSSPTCAADIRAYTSNTCKYALDCITDSTSMAICYGAIGRAGGRYCGLEPYPERQHTRHAIAPGWIMGLSIFGKKVALDGEYGREESPDDRKFGVGWFKRLQGLLDAGKLRAHPLVAGEGWEGVLEGVEGVRKRAVSGKKLVYSVA